MRAWRLGHARGDDAGAMSASGPALGTIRRRSESARLCGGKAPQHQPDDGSGKQGSGQTPGPRGAAVPRIIQAGEGLRCAAAHTLARQSFDDSYLDLSFRVAAPSRKAVAIRVRHYCAPWQGSYRRIDRLIPEDPPSRGTRANGLRRRVSEVARSVKDAFEASAARKDLGMRGVGRPRIFVRVAIGSAVPSAVARAAGGRAIERTAVRRRQSTPERRTRWIAWITAPKRTSTRSRGTSASCWIARGWVKR
ncbi:hypothetical protein MPOCJGCO_1025 [Methylobacterium trifolii]|uniref:Uncharacterized protein n=1 Tax=Methylobacterium trifolii TaxID=1003092 RepID=A0ABQ4TZB5_9HYPH|nr:hypothetical protein MPOCJGCO_1025 [Methylobacterium trifolii]